MLTPEGAPAWLVTSYDAAVQVLTDARFGVTPPTGRDPGNETLFQDGEPHARLRRLVARAFTPRRIAALRPGIEAAAAELVAAMAAAGPPADLMADLAAPLSLSVIGDLLGVPAAARDRLRGFAEPALTEGTPRRGARSPATPPSWSPPSAPSSATTRSAGSSRCTAPTTAGSPTASCPPWP
ncbi:hypothetical protein ACFQXA_22585 [Nocardiopsis composta]